MTNENVDNTDVVAGESLASVLQQNQGNATTSNTIDSASLVAVLMSAMNNESSGTHDPLGTMFSSSSLASLSAIPEVPVSATPAMARVVNIHATATPSTQAPPPPPPPAPPKAPTVVVESHEEDELLEPLPVLEDTPDAPSSSQDELLLEATKALTQALQPSEELLPLTPMNPDDDSDPDHDHHDHHRHHHLHPSAADHPQRLDHLQQQPPPFDRLDLEKEDHPSMVEQLELEREREQEQIKAREMLGLMLPNESQVIAPSSSISVSAIPFHPQPELPVEEEVYDPLLDMQMEMEMGVDQLLPEQEVLPVSADGAEQQQQPQPQETETMPSDTLAVTGASEEKEDKGLHPSNDQPASVNEDALARVQDAPVGMEQAARENKADGPTLPQPAVSSSGAPPHEQLVPQEGEPKMAASQEESKDTASVAAASPMTAADDREPTPEPLAPTIPDTFPTLDKLYYPLLPTLGSTLEARGAGRTCSFRDSSAGGQSTKTISETVDDKISDNPKDWQSAVGADLALLSEMKMAALMGTDLARFRRELAWLEGRARRWEEEQRMFKHRDPVARKLMDKALGLTVTHDYSPPTTPFDQHQQRQLQREYDRRMEKRNSKASGRTPLAPPPPPASPPPSIPSVIQQEFRISSETRLALSMFKVSLAADVEEQARLLADHEALQRSLDRTRSQMSHLSKKEDAVQKRIMALVEQEPERERELVKLDKLERACEAMMEQQSQQWHREIEVLEAKLRLLEEQRRAQSEAEAKGLSVHHPHQGKQKLYGQEADGPVSSPSSSSSSQSSNDNSDSDDDEMESSVDDEEAEETRDTPLAMVMSSRTPVVTSASTLPSHNSSSSSSVSSNLDEEDEEEDEDEDEDEDNVSTGEGASPLPLRSGSGSPSPVAGNPGPSLSSTSSSFPASYATPVSTILPSAPADMEEGGVDSDDSSTEKKMEQQQQQQQQQTSVDVAEKMPFIGESFVEKEQLQELEGCQTQSQTQQTHDLRDSDESDTTMVASTISSSLDSRSSSSGNDFKSATTATATSEQHEPAHSLDYVP
ncbi:hypothetical protein BGW42_006239 [Actinomortierella wolfii]|nr:hypothetical protein BGW42_006239 [Actinomortierella wolfii]